MRTIDVSSGLLKKLFFGATVLFFVIGLAPSPLLALEPLTNDEMSKVDGYAGLGGVLSNFQVSSDPANDIDQRLTINSGGQLQIGTLNWHAANNSDAGLFFGTKDDPFRLEADGGNPSKVRLQFPDSTGSVPGSAGTEIPGPGGFLAPFDLGIDLLENDGDGLREVGRIFINDGINPSTFLELGVNQKRVQLGVGIALNGSGGFDADGNDVPFNAFQTDNNNTAEDFDSGEDLFIENLFFSRTTTTDRANPPTEGEFFDQEGGSPGSIQTPCTDPQSQDCDFSDDLLQLFAIGPRPLNIDFVDNIPQTGQPGIVLQMNASGGGGAGALGIERIQFGDENFGHTVIQELNITSFDLRGPIP